MPETNYPRPRRRLYWAIFWRAVLVVVVTTFGLLLRMRLAERREIASRITVSNRSAVVSKVEPPPVPAYEFKRRSNVEIGREGPATGLLIDGIPWHQQILNKGVQVTLKDWPDAVPESDTESIQQLQRTLRRYASQMKDHPELAWQIAYTFGDWKDAATARQILGTPPMSIRYVPRFKRSLVLQANENFVFSDQRFHSSIALLNSSTIVSADGDAFAQIDFISGETKKRNRIADRYMIRLVASPDGSTVVGAESEKPFQRLDVATNTVTPLDLQLSSSQDQSLAITGIPQAISADSKTLVYLDDHKHRRGWHTRRIVLCDMATGGIRKLDVNGIEQVFSSEKPRQKTLRKDFKDEDPEFKNQIDITHARFLPGEQRLIASGNRPEVNSSSFLACVDAATGKIQSSTDPILTPVTSLAVATEVPIIATTHQWSQTIRIWQCDDLRQLAELSSPGATIKAIALSANGQQLTTIDDEGVVSLWDLSTQQRQVLGTHGLAGYQVLFSPDQTQIISSAADSRIKVWRTSDIVSIELPGQSDVSVTDIAGLPEFRPAAILQAERAILSPDGHFLAICDQVQIWDAKTGKGIADYDVVNAADLAFSHDATRLYVVNNSGKVKFIDLKNQGVIQPVPFPAPPALQLPDQVKDLVRRFGSPKPASNGLIQISRDGAFAAIKEDGHVRHASLSQPEQTSTIPDVRWNAQGGSFHRRPFLAVALNGDGSLIAAASTDALLVRRGSTGETIRQLSINNFFKKKCSLSFTPDGTLLACLIGTDTTVYDLTTGSARVKLRGTMACVFLDNAKEKLLIAERNGDVSLIDLSDRERTVLFTIGEPVLSMSVNREGEIAVTESSGAVQIFQPLPNEIERQKSWERVPDQEFMPVVNGEIIPSGQSYAQWREQFTTYIRALGSNPNPYQQRPKTPAGVQRANYSLKRFRKMEGLLYRPKQVKKPLPAIVFLHGGFALSGDDIASVIEITGDRFVVLAPAMRGESGNDGTLELMCGEVDDAREAAQWLASQPYVDPKRIYAFGHSVGGATSALMTLRDNVPIVHSGSCGGIYPETIFNEWTDVVPFDNTPAERKARLLVGNLQHMQRRHFAFFGNEDPLLQATDIETDGSKLSITTVAGDHFTSFAESLRRYIDIIEDDFIQQDDN